MEIECQEVNESKDILYDYLLRLIPAIGKCAGYYQTGRIADGSNLLVEMIDGLNWVIAVTAKDKVMEDKNIGEVNTMLAETVKALENQDYILAGDVLEYEILPLMQEIMNKLKANHI